jgi:hypothetical protein
MLPDSKGQVSSVCRLEALLKGKNNGNAQKNNSLAPELSYLRTSLHCRASGRGRSIIKGDATMRLKAFLFVLGRLALAQRMSAARAESKRGKQRLWLRPDNGEKTHLNGTAHEEIASAETSAREASRHTIVKTLIRICSAVAFATSSSASAQVTIYATLAGCPAGNVPAGFSPQGLPIGHSRPATTISPASSSHMPTSRRRVGI